jgi:hypothetical protein
VKAKFIENFTLWRRRQLSFIKNEERRRLSSPEFFCPTLIITPKVSKDISTIHATDRYRHTVSTTRDSSNFYCKYVNA